MSLSVLRTADAWWVSVPSGAAKVTTTATTAESAEAARYTWNFFICTSLHS